MEYFTEKEVKSIEKLLNKTDTDFLCHAKIISGLVIHNRLIISNNLSFKECMENQIERYIYGTLNILVICQARFFNDDGYTIFELTKDIDKNYSISYIDKYEKPKWYTKKQMQAIVNDETFCDSKWDRIERVFIKNTNKFNLEEWYKINSILKENKDLLHKKLNGFYFIDYHNLVFATSNIILSHKNRILKVLKQILYYEHELDNIDIELKILYIYRKNDFILWKIIPSQQENGLSEYMRL